jgi:aminoglycoside 3-N-acetyltransferase
MPLDSLVAAWRASGVESGDVVLVHSSLKRTLLAQHTTPEEVYQSFLEAVGTEGTVVFPLFNFGFTEGEPFDMRTTPSRMGALTEVARTDPRAVRSGHPIYSFAAIGPQAHRFDVDNQSGYGPDSPFAVLRELRGKIGVLDLHDQNSMTFYHHVEEMLDVDYRFHKKFTGQYTDTTGNTTERTYSLFVRDFERGVETDVNRMGDRLWDRDLYKGSRRLEGSGLRTIDANALFDEVASVIQAGEAAQFLISINTP